MGRYVTEPIDKNTYLKIIELLRNGYVDDNGKKHRPNDQVANVLVLEANLGCRLGDILNLEKKSFKKDGNIWRLDIKEEKTGKTRTFIVPQPVIKFINEIAKEDGRLFNITKQAVWYILRDVTSYLGLKNVSSHSFRKYASLELYEKSDHDVALVSQFLQHSSTKITAAYLKRDSKQMESAIEKIVNLA